MDWSEVYTMLPVFIFFFYKFFIQVGLIKFLIIRA